MKPEVYAEAVMSLLEKGMKPKDVVNSINSSLKAAGRVALMPHIARAFARLGARRGQRNRSILIVAKKKHERTARKESGAHEIPLQVDENLIGGWRLENKEELVDASWKKHLLSIYNRATSS